MNDVHRIWLKNLSPWAIGAVLGIVLGLIVTNTPLWIGLSALGATALGFFLYTTYQNAKFEAEQKRIEAEREAMWNTKKPRRTVF